jgi:small subunit ribosomal protein S1
MKNLIPDPWKNVTDKYPVGTRITGVISKTADFGIFVRLENDIEGLIHISEIDEDKKQKMKEVFKEGDKIDAMVISSDTKERKLGLSLNALAESDERSSYQAFTADSEKQKTSLGDLIKEASMIKNKNSVPDKEE